ncbi:MAG: GGDEF domain-containing protein [Thermoanaerobaculales bacterium]
MNGGLTAGLLFGVAVVCGATGFVLLHLAKVMPESCSASRVTPWLGGAVAAIGSATLVGWALLMPPWWIAAGTAVLLVGCGARAAFSLAAVAEAEVRSLRDTVRDLEATRQHLLRLAEADPLTGCANRHALRAWFERWEGGEPVSVVLVDVDDLKRINDRHGHTAGDEALCLVAEVLKSSTRPGDLVVRWGGDEFVAVLQGAGLDTAQLRFSGLIRFLQESATGFPYDEPLRVSWGVSSCASAADIAGALAEADEKMYAMKRRKGNAEERT